MGYASLVVLLVIGAWALGAAALPTHDDAALTLSRRAIPSFDYSVPYRFYIADRCITPRDVSLEQNCGSGAPRTNSVRLPSDGNQEWDAARGLHL